MSDGPFTFAPYTDDPCTGTFSIEDDLLRNAFASVSTESLGVYGLRVVEADGTAVDLGLVDPRRAAFEDMCQRFANGEAELADFQSLCPPGCGIVVNSLQSPHSLDANGFNELSEQFIANLNCKPGAFPETIELVMFMGSYDVGFGMHQDSKDVTMFVLDGRKHFVVRDGETDRRWTMTRGEYLYWRSVRLHGSTNPEREWALTLNFSVGPDDTRPVVAGAPVAYVHAATRLKDHEAFVLAERERGR